jgi:cytoskeleton protein RodZ
MPVEPAGDNEERATPLPLGAALAAERERQGMSRADAAQRLHMSPSQVEALERGDYQSLPRGTFLRGFVRNYAKVLGLEPDAMLAMLADVAPRDPAPRIVVPTQNIRFDPIGERLSSPYVKAATLAFVVVALAFAVMYWVMFVRPKLPGLAGHAPTPAAASRPAPTPAVPAPPAPEAAPPTANETVAQASTPSEPQPLAPATMGKPAPAKPAPANAKDASKTAATPPKEAAKDASKPPAAPAKEAAKDASKDAARDATSPARVAAADAAAKPAKAGLRKAIHFHFDGDSWVEIRDASGKVLYQKLNPAGTDADVAARPPVDVIVGNAPEVRMTLDGTDFPLEPHTNVAVARFTLE